MKTLLLALVLTPLIVRADVKLPAVLGSNMVLQQGDAAPVWGTAEPGEDVTVTFAGLTKTARAGADGKWQVALGPLTASKEGRPLTVKGKNLVTLENVLVGEVWICAGQSNMALALLGAQYGRLELPKASALPIRLFKLPLVGALQPQPDCTAHWDAANPQSAAAFTAVGYFFGRDLNKVLDVPVGLIEAAWGGKGIAAFIPADALAGKGWAPGKIDGMARAAARQKKPPAAAPKADPEDADEPGAAAPAPAAPGKPAYVMGPSAIFNGMVAPVIPFAIRGTIWYQGEANREDGLVYTEKMKALIGSWRGRWGRGDFPFLFVQIAPCKWFNKRVVAPWPPVEPPSAAPLPQHKLPLLWQAQLDSLKIPNTGMAVTLDVGERNAVHPRKKMEIGQRLALWALARVYGKPGLVYSGPLYASAKPEGAKLRVHFEQTGGGLASRDGQPLTCFEIAGADRVFHPAAAVIDGADVVLSSDAVPSPAAARFAWDEVAEPNFINKEGLPASPFHTDPPK